MRSPALVGLALLLSSPAGAQVRFTVPSVPAVPAAPRLALPSAPSPSLPAPALPAAPRLAPALPGAPAVPAVPAGVPAVPADRAELDFAAGAAFELGRLTDDLAAEAGLRMSRMTGSDFIAFVEAARERLDASAAPTARAAAAARDVRASVLRVVRALVKPELPMGGQAPRLMSVWQVMTQEQARAAAEGGLDAVVSDAALFAEQVEASVR